MNIEDFKKKGGGCVHIHEKVMKTNTEVNHNAGSHL